MLGVRNGGAAAWGVAVLAAGGIAAYSGQLGTLDEWQKERAREERFQQGKRLMTQGDTATRYRKATEEARKAREAKKKRGWFSGGSKK
jgi:hypothetical protein